MACLSFDGHGSTDYRRVFCCVLLSLFLSRAVAVSCYTPNGNLETSSNPFACSPDEEFSHCCNEGNECLTNGLCKAAWDGELNWYWRITCTDPTWQSPLCPKFCYNAATDVKASSTQWLVLACSSDTYCCSYLNYDTGVANLYDCCSNSSRIVSIGPAVYLTGAVVGTTTFRAIGSTSSTSATTTTTTSATTSQPNDTSSLASASTTTLPITPTQNSSPGLATSAKIGVGVGVPLGVICLAALGYLLWRHGKAAGQRRNNEFEASKQTPAEYAYNPLAQDSTQPPIVPQVGTEERPAEMGHENAAAELSSVQIAELPSKRY